MVTTSAEVLFKTLVKWKSRKWIIRLSFTFYKNKYIKGES